jgi:vancomycin aglycone glucosyltransferase
MKFVLVAYGSRGDVEPCASVGAELQRRGHDVQMALPPNMIGFAESVGLPAVGYGPDSREGMNPAADLIMDVAPGIQNPVAALPRIIEHVTRSKFEKSAALTSLAKGADAILAGFNEQGVAANVAEYHGIPMAGLHYFPARVYSSWGLFSSITKQAEDAQRLELGLPASPGAQQFLQIQAYDELCLPGAPGEWVEPGDRRPFVGALTLEQPAATDDEVLSWIAAGTPPVYFGFGSTPLPSPAETIAVLSAACARLGERGLFCSGPNDVSDAPQFDNLKVVSTVNHSAILPACRAAVLHGGAGTTAAALRAGIPMVIMWFWLDQPVWAAGVEKLKVGTGREFSASTLDSLTADLRLILNPEYADRAREVSERMTKSAQSITATADLLEETACEGRSD